MQFVGTSAMDCGRIRNQSGFKRCLQLVILRSKRLRVKLAWSSPIQSGMSIFIGYNRPNHTAWRLRGDQKHNQSNEQCTKDIRLPLTRISGLSDGQTAWKERCRNGWSVSTSNAWPSRWQQQTRKNNPDRRYGSRATWKSDPRPVVTQGS